MADDTVTLERRVRDRDPAALAEYVQARRGPLLAYVRRRVGPALARKLDPEDILQEASSSALAALPSADFAVRDPFCWLCQICEQRIVDAARRFAADKRDIKREVPLAMPGGAPSHEGLLAMLVASLTTPSQALARDQRQRRLMEALEALPDDAREAIRLRYLEGMPSKEIAARLGKTDGAVRVLLTRSLQRLRTWLGSEAAP